MEDLFNKNTPHIIIWLLLVELWKQMESHRLYSESLIWGSSEALYKAIDKNKEEQKYLFNLLK
jgi:hypothetical protein